MALQRGDSEQAIRLRRRFEQTVALLDQLGWQADADRERYELDLPKAELTELLTRLSEIAGETVETAVSDFMSTQALAGVQVLAICHPLLTDQAEATGRERDRKHQTRP